VRALHRQFGPSFSLTTSGDGSCQQQDQQCLVPNHEHHILTTVHDQNKLIPPNFINQENYFSQADISIQESYFSQEDISIQENYFSQKDISSQENNFSQGDISIQENYFSQEDISSQENYFPQEDISIQDNYFPQEDLTSQSYFPIENTIPSYSDCNEYEQAPVFHQSNNVCNNVSFDSVLDYQSPTNLLEQFDQYMISGTNSYTSNSPVQQLVPQTFENYLNIPTAEGTISVTFDVTQACKGSSLKKTNSEKCREYRNKKKEKEKHLAEEHAREMERNITLKFKLQEMEKKAETWKKYILKHVKAQKCSRNNVKVPENIVYSFCDI